MAILLNSLPVYITGDESETERWNTILPWLEENGFSDVTRLHTADWRALYGASSGTKAYLSAIEGLTPPFILLENDCCFTGNPITEIFPDPDCVAFYLGLSRWGLHRGATIFGAPRLHRHRNHPRVINMFGSHAIVYLNADFLDAYRSRANVREPCDVTLAKLQHEYLFQALNPPLFYQKDGKNEEATNITMNVSAENAEYRPYRQG